MKYFYKILFTFLFVSFYSNGQNLVQSINSGAIIGSTSSVSVGEIFVNPENENNSSSGIISILATINQETLTTPELNISENISVYPNPTTASIHFKADTDLENEKIFIYSNSGKLVKKTTINSSNSIDLSEFSTGIYFIQFESNKYNSFKIIKQ